MIGAVSSPQAISLSLQGALWMLVFICFSLISVTIGGAYFSLGFVPLIAVFLWPRKANYTWSMLAILVAGIFQDLVSGGPLGLWAIVNCALYLMADPVNTPIKSRLLGTWGLFVFYFALACPIALVLGRISLGQWPSLLPFTMQALICVLCFPIFFGMQRFVNGLISGSTLVEVD